MNLRANSICIFVAILGWCGTVAIGQEAAIKAGDVTDDLPAEVRDILTQFEKESQEIRSKAEKETSVEREKACKRLDELQQKYNQKEKTDEAIAIREKIRQLRIAHLKPRPNPGTLMNFGNKIGQTFFFDVTGGLNGIVWGTDAYTLDSSLAASAVHAGVLKVGQRGTVRVTIVNSPERHEGSERNGVRTNDWGSYPASYRVRRPLSTDKNTTESP